MVKQNFKTPNISVFADNRPVFLNSGPQGSLHVLGVSLLSDTWLEQMGD